MLPNIKLKGLDILNRINIKSIATIELVMIQNR